MNKLHSLSGRLIFRLIRPFLPLHSAPRSRVLITDGRGNILLLRGWLGRQQWDLPGGGIKRGEPALQAALREVREETSLVLKETDIKLVGEFSKQASRLTHGVILFHAQVPMGPAAPQAKYRFEILEARWWPVSALPSHINAFVLRALGKLGEIEV